MVVYSYRVDIGMKQVVGCHKARRMISEEPLDVDLLFFTGALQLTRSRFHTSWAKNKWEKTGKTTRSFEDYNTALNPFSTPLRRLLRIPPFTLIRPISSYHVNLLVAGKDSMISYPTAGRKAIQMAAQETTPHV